MGNPVALAFPFTVDQIDPVETRLSQTVAQREAFGGNAMALEQPLTISNNVCCPHLDDHLFKVLQEQHGRTRQTQQLMRESRLLLVRELVVEREPKCRVKALSPQGLPFRLIDVDRRRKPHDRHLNDCATTQLLPQPGHQIKRHWLAESKTHRVRIGLGSVGDLQDGLESKTLFSDAGASTASRLPLRASA